MAKKISHLSSKDCKTMLWTEDLLYSLAEIESSESLRKKMSKARAGLRGIINNACR